MIRHAKLTDLEACTDLTCEFFSSFLTTRGVPVIRDDVKRIAQFYIQKGQCVVVEHDKQVCGVAAWLIENHPANQGIKIFYEACWCVKSKFKTDTLLLLRTMEREAKASGAVFMVMANLANEKENQIRNILTKKNYTFLETHYGKTIQGG